ncbi:MAG: hypothetical protein OHK0053_04340 [Microscillaceae bacterium]
MDPWMIITLASVGASGMLGLIGWGIWYEMRKVRRVNEKISDQTVIEIARENGGKINIALLCERTGLSASEAKTKLKYLQQNRVISTDWKQLFQGGGAYVLTGTDNTFAAISQVFEKNEWVNKLGFGDIFKSIDKSGSPAISPTPSQSKDAMIISLALENEGVVSASSVCVKLNISIDEAQKRLEDLRQKQIFISEVNQNGGLVYRLLDA